jgi:hypothetical protein
MRQALIAVLLTLTGCRIDLDSREVPRQCNDMSKVAVCLEADDHSDYEWIQTNIFATNCSGSSCHGAGTPGGRLDLSAGVSYATLMGDDGSGVLSSIDPRHKLVEPGRPEESYLFFIMRGLPEEQTRFDEPPDEIGYMPAASNPLCCQKVDAIRRWIEAGARPPAS